MPVGTPLPGCPSLSSTATTVRTPQEGCPYIHGRQTVKECRGGDIFHLIRQPYGADTFSSRRRLWGVEGAAPYECID